MEKDEKVKQIKFIKASELLKLKANKIREYEVIWKPEEMQRNTTAIYSDSRIYEPEYVQALQLQEQLIHEFDGKSLETTFVGEVVFNDFGKCYHIQDECSSHLKKIDHEQSRRRIISDLKLVHGIGPVSERRLKQQGYLTIENLRMHPRWKNSALQFLELMEVNDIGSLQKWLWRCLPKSHPLVHYLASCCRDEDFTLLDIETLGLFGRFISHLTEKTALITFNGRSFDIPYIRERLEFYGIDGSLSLPHFDLLYFSRRAWRTQLSNCKLETLEKHLGVNRTVDIPSALVPEFYETYLKTGNIGPLVAIVEHNKQDLCTLARLFSKLSEAWTS